MEFIENQYLDEIRSTIRARKVPWEGYVRAELLNAEQASLFKTLEKYPVAEWVKPVSENLQQYVSTTMALLSPPSRDDVVRYIALFVGDVITTIPEFTTELLADSRCWPALTALLTKPDEQITILTTRVLAILANSQIAPVEVIAELVAFLGDKFLTSPNTNLQDIAVQELALLAQTKFYRPVIWEKRSVILPQIIQLAQSPQFGLQVQYYSLLVLWLISYDRTIAKGCISEYNSAQTLLETAKLSVKEKIVRVSVATLANYVRFSPHSAIPAIISQRGLQIVNLLSERKWADDELRQDVETLKQQLTDAYNSMTTFDEYYAELKTKRLLWSPTHRSSSFWKTYIEEFRSQDWAVLKQLVQLLQTSEEPVTQAVACNDIACIVNTAPQSVTVLNKLGAKIKIMELMNSADPEVRYEALKATQALIGHMFAS